MAECDAPGPEPAGGATAGLRQAGYELAAVGFTLSERLFSPNAVDPEQVRVAEAARRWLEQLSAQESAITLEVLSEEVGYVPWNPVYGRPRNTPGSEALKSFERQALHAAVLEFRHPRTHREMTFASELPQDIKTLLIRLNSVK